MEWDEICVIPEDENLADETGYHLFYYGISRPICFWLTDRAAFIHIPSIKNIDEIILEKIKLALG